MPIENVTILCLVVLVIRYWWQVNRGRWRRWREQKSRRGAKKRIGTHGLACLNPNCPYFGVSDEQLHALEGNGKPGKDHDIQYLRDRLKSQADA